MMKFYLNNEFHDLNDPVFVSDHRAILFGDGLFETIRVFNKETPFIADHIHRLLAGMNLLGMDVPEHFTPIYFSTKISELLLQNAISNARIRITVMRRGKGRYGPQKRSVDWMIHAEPLGHDQFVLNQRGLQMTIFDEIKKPSTNISNVKSTSALVYVLAALFKNKMAKDDCVILNEFGRVAEAHSSNLFGIKNDAIFTPPISEACVAGVMRKKIIDLLKENDYKVYEEEMAVDNLLDMQSVFLTNSIQGIQWIESIDITIYKIGMIPILMDKLNQLVSTT